MNVDHLISHDGYWALFSLIFLEGVGIPVPGEAILVTAGTYAGKYHHLNVWIIFLVASLAAVLGPAVGYLIGAKGGYRLVRKYGRYIHVRDREMKIGRYVFDRYGGPVVFFGRFVVVLRTYMGFLGGTNRMALPKFLTYELASGVLWSAIYALASYAVGSSLQRASGEITWALVGVGLLVLVAVVLFLRRQHRRLGAVAEAAYPGPLPD